MTELVRKLWSRLDDERLLLNSAVRQLAALHVREGYSVERWVNDWYARHRTGGDPTRR
jgi:hypothetical protein